ncbi:MAG TPA: hypothetical protein VG826_04360 [Pirellulales bacterium]|nr:hypothetical protein [Pirellulales bacterium]
MKHCITIILAAAHVLALLSPAAAQTSPADGLSGWTGTLKRAVPTDAARFSDQSNAALDKAAQAVEQWAVLVGKFGDARTSDQILDRINRLLEAKHEVDGILDATLDLRRQFAAQHADAARHRAICAYLAATSRLIDLSGRLRYLQVDAVSGGAPKLAMLANERQRLLESFSRQRSSVGAYFAVRSWLAPGEGGRLPRLDKATRGHILDLASQVDEPVILPLLVQTLYSREAEAELAISVAETIRRIGLPQEPWPDPLEAIPPPPITPGTLHEALAGIPKSSLAGDLAARHADLLKWLDGLKREGLTETSYRVGNFEVQPGDFLLMRNPSPYNQFTDLSPGLFTHVGVVTLAPGSDGIQRMVLVDLPERGNRIPAANVEAYVQRSLHYCFLRHPDPQIAAALAGAARDVIGNESLFDLNFRLQGVLGLKGQPLKGKKVETYCAGLLLLCALQTSAGRQEFFPVQEHPRGGKMADNLAKLGLSMDDDFISPTGALFSQRLTLVGRREPMYDPRREVEEAVFDHFAWLMANRRLVPSPDLFQSLRLKLAEASRGNSLLAEALAKAARVNADTDLVSAAKAGAVVETLDEIAFGASGEFLDASDFLRDEPAEALAREGEAADVVADAQKYQRRHTALYQAFRSGKLSPRQLRIELVKYYTAFGKRQLEQRFFAPVADDKPRPSEGKKGVRR